MSSILPVKKNEWYISRNNTGATGGSILGSYQSSLFRAKEVLISLPIPWTVHSSSDGTIAGSSDFWLDPTDLIWATPPAAHSWVVLQHPTQSTQFCLDCDRSVVSGRIMSMYVSFGGNYTGGSITAKPTAIDEVEAGVGQQWLGPILVAFNSWVHAWQSPKGNKNRLYIATSAGNGEGTFWLFDEIDTPASEWENPNIALIAHHKGISGGSVFEIDRMMTTDSGIAAPSQILSETNVISLLASPLKDPSVSYFSNSSVRFNQSGTIQNEYITMGDVAELSFERTDAFSISCWFRTTGHSSSTQIVSKRESGGNNRGYGIQLQPDGLVAWRLVNDSVSNNRLDKITTAAFDDGNWHHCIVTYDGSSSAAGANIYIDGALQTVTTEFDALSATINTTAEFSISGRNAGAAEEFFGSISDVSVFNKELSASEVTTIYNGGNPADIITSGVDGYVGYWRMGDGDTYPTITDSSASGNDGTMTNMEESDIRGDSPSNPLLLFKVGSQNAETAVGTGDMITERVAVGNELDTSNTAYPMVPISLISGYGYRGMHGFLDDLYWGTDLFDTDPGNTYPAQTSNRQWAQAGHVIHPWTEDDTVPYFGISTVEPHTAMNGHFTGVDDTSGNGKVEYFQMTAIDEGAPLYPTYTSWVVRDNPDTSGTNASPDYGPISNIHVSARWIENG